MLDLDMRSGQPIYQQLVERFKELIISEVLQADEQLPSVRILAGQLTINPNTIQKAYRELERQGYIYSLPGKGSYVARIAHTGHPEKLARLKEELVRILAEAIYLGMPREEIMDTIAQVEKRIQGVNKNDGS